MSTLNGRATRQVVAKTADYTVVAANDQGKIFTNEGAAGAVVFSLPAATVGQHYEFHVLAAQQLRIDPNGTETIGLPPSTGAQQAAGAYIWADAVGESVAIVCVKAGSWHVRGIGTWTAV